MKKISIFVLAVFLLAPMSINAAERDETEGTMEALSNEVTGTWTAINNGLANTTVHALVITPTNPIAIWAGTDDGVFKSGDGGGTWSVNGLSNAFINALAIDPSHPGSICAAGNGVYGSNNDGISWSTIACCELVSYSVAIDPASVVYEGNSWGVVEWTGGSYNFIITTPVYALANAPSDPSVIYGGGDGARVFKITHGQVTWPSPGKGLTNPPVNALAIEPTNSNIIYAGTDGGVFRSTDGGGDWSAVNNGLNNPSVYALAIDPENSSIIYAGTDGGGVFETTDGGNSWSAINNGLTNTHVTSLAIDPSNPDIIYAGTNGGGVFKLFLSGGPPSLHVSKSGTGDGTVTSTPTGIDCGSICSASYAQGTSVTLTATPSSGSVFAGWSGACSGTGNCTVTMDSDKSVTATFNSAGGYSLTVVKAGTGDGTVTSSPAGISCGSACSETFQTITKMKLTAKANTDCIFTGWSGGGCTGTKPCQVTVDSAISITASFDKKVPHVSVSLTSLDFGSVKVGKSLKKTLKIMNHGTGDLTVSIGGVTGTDFSVAGSTNVTVKPNRSYSLGITFKPSSTGSKAVTLVLSLNDPDAVTISISLTGTGT